MNPRRPTLGVLLLLFVVALPPTPAAAQSKTHMVRGRVVNVETGVPVARAQVTVLGQRRPTVTDAAGLFRHDRLIAASYLLHIEKEGYVAMTWEVASVDDTSIVHLFELRPLHAGGASGDAGPVSLRGRVVDRETQAPVAGAEVFVVGRPEPAITDTAGRFRHRGLAIIAHTIEVRRIGYEPVTLELFAVEDTAVVYPLELPRLDVVILDSVLVTGAAVSYWHADFERRRSEGRGQFVTRDEIERRNAASVGDLLRTLNGLRMICNNHECAVRMTRTNCRPAYVADGIPADAITVERMPVNDLFGVEVYDLFEVPIQLQRADLRCGVIAVWTRRGPPPN